MKYNSLFFEGRNDKKNNNVNLSFLSFLSLKTLCVISFLFSLSTFHLNAQTAVGHWHDWLDYSHVYHVASTPDGIYAAGRGGLFRFDPDDGTLVTLSRSTGLSDVGIATMAYGEGCLVVAYNNSNIDIIDGGRVYNLSDIKRSSIAGDRDIYNIRFHRGMAYLCTGFGVVVLDLQRREIKETYYLGNAGTYTTVRDIAFTADSIYAATAEGLKRLSVSEQHPGISERWTADHRLDSTTVTTLSVFGSHLLAVNYDDDPTWNNVVVLDDGTASSLVSGEVRSVQVCGNRLVVCVEGSVGVYDTALNPLGQYSNYSWGVLDPYDAVYDKEGTLWVGHPWEGIVGLHTDGSDEYHKPAGPGNADHVFRLKPFDGKMMVCPGGYNAIYIASYFAADIFSTDGRNWTSLDRTGGALDTLSDIIDIASDGTKLYAATWGKGLLEISGDKLAKVYNQTNSNGALQQFTSGDWSTLIIGGVACDKSDRGGLWLLNSRSPSPLVHFDGTRFTSHNTESMTGTAPELNMIVFDSVNHYIWFAGRSNNIYVHDGNSRMARVDPNHGSKMETESVNCMVQDREGNIWIGTNKGIKVIYDGYHAFQNGGNGETAPVNCNNITITNGSFAEYLMAYENITCIAVDGANRKWVGTAAGGLYLLSSNGLNQLQNFTTANSPLFSDKIICLGIMPESGDVYIGTDQGLQVYRSTATYAEPYTAEQVYAYPNPVRPGYDGPIAIKGFARDAIVHITDASGHTVFSTQALGGQAVWNGRTHDGQRVASGVYYVFASDGDGKNRAVAKILIIR